MELSLFKVTDEKQEYLLPIVKPGKRYLCYYMYYENDQKIYVKHSGFTVLMALVMQSLKKPETNKIIKSYVKEHPDQINKQCGLNLTALMLAVRNCGIFTTIDVVNILIESGADANMADLNGHTALNHAISNNHELLCDMIKIL